MPNGNASPTNTPASNGGGTSFTHPGYAPTPPFGNHVLPPVKNYQSVIHLTYKCDRGWLAPWSKCGALGEVRTEVLALVTCDKCRQDQINAIRGTIRFTIDDEPATEAQIRELITKLNVHDAGLKPHG